MLFCEASVITMTRIPLKIFKVVPSSLLAIISAIVIEPPVPKSSWVLDSRVSQECIRSQVGLFRPGGLRRHYLS